MEILVIGQIALYIIAVVLTLLGILRFKKYKDTELWIEVPAKINAIKELSYSPFLSIFSGSSLFRIYYPEINYSYFFNGENLESDRVSLNLSNIGILLSDNFVTESYKHRFWYKWKKEHKIKAFINPDNPRESVLINKMSQNFKSTNIALVLVGLLIACFSFYGLPYITSN